MLEQLLAGLEASALPSYLRYSRWSYAAVNGLHVLGIAVLVGSVLPLNLRLLGFWPAIPLPSLARILVPLAATGLALAVAAGFLLFSIRAGEYAALAVFQVKMALVALGTLSAISFHWRFGFTLEGAPPVSCRRQALLSLGCWLAALSLGRLIAFVAEG